MRGHDENRRREAASGLAVQAACLVVCAMSDASPRFIHLRLHSAYSLIEGAIQVKSLPKMCAADGMPAVAVTDTGNLFAALEFSETAAKAGVQPIIGAQIGSHSLACCAYWQ